MGFVISSFICLSILLAIFGSMAPENKTASAMIKSIQSKLAGQNPENSSESDSILYHSGFGKYTFDDLDDVEAAVNKETDPYQMMTSEEILIEYGYSKDYAPYMVTSIGKHLKGYIDYTRDGYVVVLQPKLPSTTRKDFIATLDSFRRFDE